MAQINKPNTHFNPVLYTGNGSTQSITGVGFQPDLLWIKNRDASASHALIDSVRGLNSLRSNTTGAEFSNSYFFSSLDSDGFTFNNTETDANASGVDYVAWNWLAGGTAVSNTQGSITSSVSANTTSGFSIVSYTGNGTSGANFGHGLGVKPACVIVKSRSLGAQNWQFVSKALSATPFASGNYLKLNATDAMGTNTAVWNTEPTSSLIYLTSSADTNSSGATYVCYAFAEKKGFSKFGSYTGNGSTDGTFVYTGFKPAFVLIRNISSINNWVMLDNKRNSYNVENLILYPNNTDADTSSDSLDFLSNGFKIRTTGGDRNASGSTLIYMAFAENPLVGTNNIPATAR